MFGFMGMIPKTGKMENEDKALFRETFLALEIEDNQERPYWITNEYALCLTDSPGHSVNRHAGKTFQNGSFVIVFGTILNDYDSSDELINSIYYSYKMEGTGFFSKLNGSFSLFIYDSVDQLYCLVVDKFASKPILYFQNKDHLIFSPDIRSFVNYPSLPRKINYSALSAFLSSGCLHNDDTWIQDVNYLQGGRIIQIKRGQTKVKPYWDCKFDSQGDEGGDYFQKKLFELLVQAVERCMKVTSNAGLFLSGGYDSRTLLGACREIGKPITNCSFYGRDIPNSDYALAERISKLNRMPFLSLKYRCPDLLNVIDKTALFFGGMRLPINEYEGIGKISGKIDLTLWGDQPFGRTLRSVKSDDILRLNFLYRMEDQSIWRQLISPEYYDTLISYDQKAKGKLMNRVGLYKVEDQTGYLYVTERLVRNMAPRLLFVNKYAEVLNPWLDNDILNFVKSLPYKYRENKMVLKMMAEKNFPDLIDIPPASTESNFSSSAFLKTTVINGSHHLLNACCGDEYSIDKIFSKITIQEYIKSTVKTNLRQKIIDQFLFPGGYISSVGADVIRFILKRSSMVTSLRPSILAADCLQRLAVVRYMAGKILKLDI